MLSATLELNMSRSNSDGKKVSLHKAKKDWGEESSDADGEEGGGAPAETGDATWLHTFSNTGTWDMPGGDYDALESASTVVGDVGMYSWSSPQMASDVQDWLDGTADNFGWLLLGDESSAASAKRFDSRENPEEAKRPVLTVRYVMPLSDYTVFAPLIRAAD